MFAAALNIAGADVIVVLLYSLDDAIHCQAIGRQLLSRRSDQVFLGIATDGVDFGDARNQAQLGLDDPILDLSQVRGRIGRSVRLSCVVLGLNRPQVDFAKTRRYRPHSRVDPSRKLASCLLNAFVNELTGKVDVGAVLEHHDNLRQAVARHGSDLLQVGQAGHYCLDRIANTLLGLQRRIAWCGRVDLHLHIGDIRYRINGQLLIAVHTICAHPEHREQDQPSMLNGKANNSFKHDCRLSRKRQI